MPGFGLSLLEAQSISSELKEKVLLVEEKTKQRENQSKSIEEKLCILNEKLELVVNHVVPANSPPIMLLGDRGD